jgi:hypothetical protein
MNLLKVETRLQQIGMFHRAVVYLANQCDPHGERAQFQANIDARVGLIHACNALYRAGMREMGMAAR